MENTIKEMARFIVENTDLSVFDIAENIAQELYNAGYRKQSEPFPQAHENGGEWISVEDRLPEETGKYLVATKNGVVYQTKYYSGGKWGQKDKGKNITYWMPLPEAPKGGE